MPRSSGQRLRKSPACAQAMLTHMISSMPWVPLTDCRHACLRSTPSGRLLACSAWAAASILVCSQENVLAEAAMMIPDTRQRLEKALQELQSTLVSSPSPGLPTVQRPCNVLAPCCIGSALAVSKQLLRRQLHESLAVALQAETAEAAADTEELAQAQEAMRQAQTLLSAAEPP